MNRGNIHYTKKLRILNILNFLCVVYLPSLGSPRKGKDQQDSEKNE